MLTALIASTFLGGFAAVAAVPAGNALPGLTTSGATDIEINPSAAWFDAGIRDYTAWPVAEVIGVGKWSNTDAAELKRTGEKSVLRVSALATDAPLTFKPFVAHTNLTRGACLDLNVVFIPYDKHPDVTPTAKGALYCFEESEGVYGFYGLMKDPAGTTNRIFRLEGATPDVENESALTLSIKKDGNAAYIKYSVNGTDLTLGGAAWNEIVLPDETLTSICCYGSGTLADMLGWVEADFVTLTVPEVANMTVEWVKAGGVAVAPESAGRYRVPVGSVVSVGYKPNAGYWLDKRVQVFYAGDEDLDLPEDGRPVAKAGTGLFINEVMASNETGIKTPSGAAGLDWVEIYNAGGVDADITGWSLTDKPDKPKKWAEHCICGPAVVPAGGYLIVFCDSDKTDWGEADVYSPIGLSGSGESVALVKPKGEDVVKGEIVSQVTFEQQFKDVSFGVGRRERSLLTETSPAEYRVGSGDWKKVDGPVAMSAAETGFQVVAYKFKENPRYYSDVERMVADRTQWSQNPVTSRWETISFNGGSSQDFPSVDFSKAGVSGDGFALHVTGTVRIPRAGQWTFASGSDDGFIGIVSRRGQNWEWSYDGPRGYAQQLSTFSLPEAGDYDFDYWYWEKDSNAGVDISIAEGEYLEFDKTKFNLIGGAASGVVHGGGYNAKAAVDLEGEMLGKSATLDWRSEFVLDGEPLPGDSFQLKIRYADGFTAKMNGTEFANVAAAGKRAPEATLTEALFDVPSELLTEGTNVLEVTGRNNAADDPDFFLSPALSCTANDGNLVYFQKPTPGAENSHAGRTGLTPVVTLSEPHGYKNAPFQLTMSNDANAVIYYTTDGSAPTLGSARYDGPITIDKTTVIRAAVPDADSILQRDVSATYLFIEDIVRQCPGGAVPQGFPESEKVNGQKFKYGMDQTLLDDATAKARLYAGFTNDIRTVSIVIDRKHLFDKAQGIYVNATGDGRGWERPTMAEQINPADASDGFTVSCGLRIRGAFSRGKAYPKHSFRLFFRSDYGQSKLTHKVFGDEGASEFDKIDLRTDQNQSYANGRTDETLVHDVFSRDSQRDMGGSSYARTRYFNLFINGIYWGVYMYEERCCQEHAASYNGGKEENYDVVRTSTPGYSTGVVEGSSDAYDEFWTKITVGQGYGSSYPNNYNKVRGLNPDGSRNPDYPVYLNVTNLIIANFSSHFGADTDSPANKGTANNVAAYRCRVDGAGKEDGWMFNRHDAEWSLVFDSKTVKTDTTENGSPVKYPSVAFNHQGIHWRLCDNAEYRQVFADLAYKNLVRKGGAMTGPVARARFESRMDEITRAIVCENARWGGTRQNWKDICGKCLSFIDDRAPNLITIYRNRGWYPSVDAPTTVDKDGATLMDDTTIAADEKVRFTSAGGTVYYTLDGSDPRLEGGTIRSGAVAYDGNGFNVPAAGCTVMARVRTDAGVWSALETVRLVGSVPPVKYTDYVRFYAVNGLPPEGAGDSNEWIVLTNLNAETGFDLEGMKVTIVKVDTKTGKEDSDPKCVFTVGATNVAAGGAIRFDQAVEGWKKITNGKINLYLKDEDDVAFQTSTANQKDFPTVYGPDGGPGYGAYLIATSFSNETAEADWRPSFTAEKEFLRFAAINGIPPEGEGKKAGDTNEWVVVTNVCPWAKLDLAGVRIVALKDGDAEAKCDFTVASGTVKKGEAARFDQNDYLTNGWEKITNNKLVLSIFDKYGELAQEAKVTQKDFATVYGAGGPGGGAYLIATNFAASIASKDWKPSFGLPEDPDAAKAVKEALSDKTMGATYGAWLANKTATETNANEKIKSFTGTKAQFNQFYLIDETPCADEIELEIPLFKFDADGNIVFDGLLSLGDAAVEHKIIGTLKLKRYDQVGDATPAAVTDLGNVLPIPAEKRTVEKPAGKDAGFYRIVIE